MTEYFFFCLNYAFKETCVIKLSQVDYMLLSVMVLPLCFGSGRGVFSCTEFDKGDFLLEYRGHLISKEEYERRQRIYHNALKVFMFEFRYNGKHLWYVQVFDVHVY